jgi:hypothetical protein
MTFGRSLLLVSAAIVLTAAAAHCLCLTNEDGHSTCATFPASPFILADITPAHKSSNPVSVTLTGQNFALPSLRTAPNMTSRPL